MIFSFYEKSVYVDNNEGKIMLAMVAIVAVAAVSIITGVSIIWSVQGGASFFGSYENTICNKGRPVVTIALIN